MRGQILAEREKDFVLAARALGLKEKTIIIRHILPSVFNFIIVNMTLGYASSLTYRSSGLSYLGFGVKRPSPSWGNMLDGVANTTVIENYWWQWLLPALCVMLTALSVNLMGDALRDAMDPKSNQK
ncbi:ABC transporter permease [Erysipelothrix sp. Poltava]|nr:ABC transporter permease [Erysipelothrix sp. Poltava]